MLDSNIFLNNLLINIFFCLITSKKSEIIHADRSASLKTHFDKNARANLNVYIFICILRQALSLVIVVIENIKNKFSYSVQVKPHILGTCTRCPTPKIHILKADTQNAFRRDFIKWSIY